MKTLLQINSVVNAGSTGRIAEDIGQVAISNGWNSYIAYGRNKRPSQSKLIKIGNKFDLILHVIKTRIFDRHGLGSRRATQKLIKEIIIIKPDIIHLHNVHGYYINIKVLFEYLAEANIPVVWTFYDCWPLTGHCSYFDYVNCQKWKSGCSKCPQKTKYPASFFIDRSKKNYYLKKELFTTVKNMAIISNSRWLGDIINQSFFKNYPANVINSGIDINIFRPVLNITTKEKYQIVGKFVVLGVAYQWTLRKGLKDFVKLSERISKDDVIVLVGMNPKQIKKLPPNIIGVSRTESTQELAELYTASDVFLNPTWEDNFPTTNMEAMACGTPVVTYRTGGSIESVCPKTGFIVNQGDINGLVAAIEHVKEKGKRYFSDACRERVERMYNKNDRFTDYINLYNQFI